MNEKQDFANQFETPKRHNQDLEAYQAKVYEANPDAMPVKEELANLLDTEPFNEDYFRKVADGYNQEKEGSKGFEGQYTVIETIRGKHGQLNVYHFRGSDSVKFGYGHFR